MNSTNYRFPEHCCGSCTNSYVNTYGDFQCTALASGNVIDIGGVCDTFQTGSEDKLQTVLSHFRANEERYRQGLVESKACNGCMYYESTTCLLTGKVAKKICKDYETQVVQEGSCAQCKYSYYDETVPRCQKTNEVITETHICKEYEYGG